MNEGEYKKSSFWSNKGVGESIACLDGHFTAKQLEHIAKEMETKQWHIAATPTSAACRGKETHGKQE